MWVGLYAILIWIYCTENGELIQLLSSPAYFVIETHYFKPEALRMYFQFSRLAKLSTDLLDYMNFDTQYLNFPE